MFINFYTKQIQERVSYSEVPPTSETNNTRTPSQTNSNQGSSGKNDEEDKNNDKNNKDGSKEGTNVRRRRSNRSRRATGITNGGEEEAQAQKKKNIVLVSVCLVNPFFTFSEMSIFGEFSLDLSVLERALSMFLHVPFTGMSAF